MDHDCCKRPNPISPGKNNAVLKKTPVIEPFDQIRLRIDITKYNSQIYH